MSRGGKGKKRAFHFKNIKPADPEVRRFGDWLPENQYFFACFRRWLKDAGYGDSALNIYSVAARQIIGYLDKPYWTIDPETDLARAWQHLCQRPLTPSTLDSYEKGWLRLDEYIRLRCHRPPRTPHIHWEYFFDTIPIWMQADIREFLHHCQRNWQNDRKFERLKDTLGHLTLPLRWLVAHFPMDDLRGLTPKAWYAYLDARLASGINPKTLNHDLGSLKHFVFYLQEHDRPVCERFLLVVYLDEGRNLPKDVPIDQLRKLQKLIQAQTQVTHAGWRRIGRMDLAWFLLMLHSGLRTCEVRSLRLQDIDWEGRRIRIEQSKNMKDRMVYLSQATVDALQAYLEVRGVAEALPDFVFIFRHRPLTRSYFFERLRTYCQVLGIHVHPHQLRHSCATLLLNSGAPVLTVQTLLGHKWVDTTLGYARLYDGTVANDYYQAMSNIEKQLSLPEDRLSQPVGIGQLLAMVDAIRQGTLTEAQSEMIRELRAGLMTLADQADIIHVVKVQASLD
jgi:site-specific recombinase XerD